MPFAYQRPFWAAWACMALSAAAACRMAVRSLQRATYLFLRAHQLHTSVWTTMVPF